MRSEIWFASCSCRVSVTTSSASMFSCRRRLPGPHRRQGVRRPLAAPAFGWRDIEAVIPMREGTTGHPAHDAEKYKWRHLVENFFCALKAFRRIATRYEKTDTCFAAMINLVAAVLWTR